MTDPAGISATIVSDSSGAVSRPELRGTRRVAPLASVKSSNGHIVLTTTSGWGFVSG